MPITEKIVATLPIGQGSDGCVFDPAKGLAFSSNGGDGTLTIVREETPDRFTVAATVPTQQGARTMTIDPKSHRVYLSAATYAAAPEAKVEDKTAPAKKGGGRRRNIVPDSFVVVVVQASDILRLHRYVVQSTVGTGVSIETPVQPDHARR